jgi:hypothetical protein
MKWKVVIMGPTGTVYTDTNAFKLLYPFPTREEAEAQANCLRTVGMKVALCDEQGHLSQPFYFSAEQVGRSFAGRGNSIA